MITLLSHKFFIRTVWEIYKFRVAVITSYNLITPHKIVRMVKQFCQIFDSLLNSVLLDIYSACKCCDLIQNNLNNTKIHINDSFENLCRKAHGGCSQDRENLCQIPTCFYQLILLSCSLHSSSSSR